MLDLFNNPRYAVQQLEKIAEKVKNIHPLLQGLFVEANVQTRQMLFRGILATNNIKWRYKRAKTTFASLKLPSFSIANLFHTCPANLHCYRALSVGQQVNC